MVLTLRFPVLGALGQALYARQSERDGALIHHSDRGSLDGFHGDNDHVSFSFHPLQIVGCCDDRLNPPSMSRSATALASQAKTAA